jgi:4-diphosphocytidyl-2-C-methyl-D-erythritol kinase
VSEDFSGPWPAPAKLNLLLRIVGRRADGYHELQTVFQFLDRADRLFFRVRSDGEVRREAGPAGVAEDADLTVRAARLLQTRAAPGAGVDIRIDKRLPMGGGLGGGSSDAATTLVALNRLWRIGLGEDTLVDLGLSLGADVPVFIRGRAAWAEGVGERLHALILPQPWYLVLTPDCHVSTGAVFSDPELTRNSPRITIADFLAGDETNDCLAVVRRGYPPVDAALRWLQQVCGQARLTGTGACVFAAFERREAAESLLAQVPSGLSGFVARGRNRSPLAEAGG